MVPLSYRGDRLEEFSFLIKVTVRYIQYIAYTVLLEIMQIV